MEFFSVFCSSVPVVAVKKFCNTCVSWGKIVFSYHLKTMANTISQVYNIPRACLLNRSPVLAMDLKSNRLGL